MSREDFIYEVNTLRRASRDGKKYTDLMHDFANCLCILGMCADDAEKVKETVDHYRMRLDLRRGEESK